MEVGLSKGNLKELMFQIRLSILAFLFWKEIYADISNLFY